MRRSKKIEEALKAIGGKAMRTSKDIEEALKASGFNFEVTYKDNYKICICTSGLELHQGYFL